MRDTFLPFSPPLIGDAEIAEVLDTLRSDWITTGPKVKRFEEEFATFVGAPGALAVNSCTSALHLALVALGVGQGDAVVTTPLTFASSAHVIEHCGATPILADVAPDTLNIDPERVRETLERNAGRRIKALLPVHLYGHAVDLAPIRKLADEYGLGIVEDAAHALPTRYQGESIGKPAKRTAVCFSFYATKNLTTAEGGMLTAEPDVLEQARIWSLHGMNRDAWKRYGAEGSWFYEVVVPGFKYNMTDIQAALGLVQLKRLHELQARRHAIVKIYDAAFAGRPEIQTPTTRPGIDHAWHLYPIRLHLDRLRINRSQFIDELRKRNIGASVHFIPIHFHPFYRDKYGYKPEDLPVASGEYQRLVSLPLNPRMSDKDVNDVIEAVTDIAVTHSR